MAVAAYVLPVAVSVEVFDARNHVAHVAVADEAVRRVVVIRVVQVCVVVAVAPVVDSRVAVAVVIVQKITRVTGVEAREGNVRRGLAEEREHLALADLPRAAQADDPRQPVQHGDVCAAVIVIADLVESRLV